MAQEKPGSLPLLGCQPPGHGPHSVLELPWKTRRPCLGWSPGGQRWDVARCHRVGSLTQLQDRDCLGMSQGCWQIGGSSLLLAPCWLPLVAQRYCRCQGGLIGARAKRPQRLTRQKRPRWQSIRRRDLGVGGDRRLGSEVIAVLPRKGRKDACLTTFLQILQGLDWETFGQYGRQRGDRSALISHAVPNTL
jgi:hypothetical protein